MSKYDALRRFLRRRPPGEVMLTFADIERLIGAFLPKAASSPAWWTNMPGTDRRSVQCRAWLAAGYPAFPGPKETVTFRLATHVVTVVIVPAGGKRSPRRAQRAAGRSWLRLRLRRGDDDPAALFPPRPVRVLAARRDGLAIVSPQRGERPDLGPKRNAP